MTCTTDITFYLDRDNSYLMTLTQNGVPADLLAITKVQFLYEGGEFNDIDNPTFIDIELTGVRLYFGKLPLPAGIYDMQVVIYSADHPLGILWDESVRVQLLNDLSVPV